VQVATQLDPLRLELIGVTAQRGQPGWGIVGVDVEALGLESRDR
jgi:hypothetical protein